MKNTIRSFIFLIALSFLMTGCTESLIKAAADVIADEVTNDSEEQVNSALRLLQNGNNFGIEWDKKDTQYAEVIYRDVPGETREAIMVGSASIVRRYICTFQKVANDVAEYLCIGTGTPALGDTSSSGEITLYFKKDREYAFFVDGGEINNILEYTGSSLSIHAP
jgi:hypothetical protein